MLSFVEYLLQKHKLGYVKKDEIGEFYNILANYGIFPPNTTNLITKSKIRKLVEKRIITFYVRGYYTINRPLLKEIIHFIKGEYCSNA